ncbi:restriction endonuclease subunit S [Streptomyces spongiae]|uniref:N-6 DNA methylase n=1 Tax=Streptomyces spongiae TaxID=565072 RepID=A0A5N8XRQ5_9ACTN|nr:restriction endonuclease subunit S [Streptomyces spongiae]MPY62102.1 N-6 DNA methylase [Streptomyces spongiae]
MNVDGRGDLPQGWRFAALGDLCDIQGGGPALPRGDRAEDGVPLVRPADLRHQRISAHAGLIRVAPEQARGWLRHRITAGDILVTRTGAVGRAALVTPHEHEWLHNTHLLRVRPRDAAQAPYLVAYLARRATADWLESRAAGTTGMRSITVRTLSELPVALPPLDQQREIGAALAAVDAKIRAHEDIVRATGALRDTLSELLMSGRMKTSP